MYQQKKMTSKISVEVKKKTLLDAYNVVRVQRDLGFPAQQKGEPLHDLMMEIKKSVNKKVKEKKISLWKELLDFWPFSIVIPSMLILIMWGAITQ